MVLEITLGTSLREFEAVGLRIELLSIVQLSICDVIPVDCHRCVV